MLPKKENLPSHVFYAANLLHCSEAEVYTLIHSGELDGTYSKKDAGYDFYPEKLEEWKQRHLYKTIPDR